MRLLSLNFCNNDLSFIPTVGFVRMSNIDVKKIKVMDCFVHLLYPSLANVNIVRVLKIVLTMLVLLCIRSDEIVQQYLL